MKKMVNRSQIIAAIARRSLGVPEEDVALAVKLVIDAVARKLASGGRVEIRNFGSFSTKVLSPRLRHNPATLTPFLALGKTRVTFKPGRALRMRIKDQNVESSTHLNEVVLSRWPKIPTESDSKHLRT